MTQTYLLIYQCVSLCLPIAKRNAVVHFLVSGFCQPYGIINFSRSQRWTSTRSQARKTTLKGCNSVSWVGPDSRRMSQRQLMTQPANQSCPEMVTQLRMSQLSIFLLLRKYLSQAVSCSLTSWMYLLRRQQSMPCHSTRIIAFTASMKSMAFSLSGIENTRSAIAWLRSSWFRGLSEFHTAMNRARASERRCLGFCRISGSLLRTSCMSSSRESGVRSCSRTQKALSITYYTPSTPQLQENMELVKRLTQEECDELMKKNPTLLPQRYQDLPLPKVEMPQVISRQATVNIGTIGHVAHGKSTVVKAISGVHTIRFKQQKVRNITIRLGYANAKIYKCTKCTGPEAFKSFSSAQEDRPKCTNKECDAELQLVRHVSFVDCPGHDILLSTMLTGAAVMDSAFLLIAANMDCPQPQTSQHLVAVQIMKLDNIIIIQNKVDLVSNNPKKIKENYEQIKSFIKDTRCSRSPILPVSAIFKYNIDVICKAICDFIPVPTRNLAVPPQLIIIRSFDVNLPSTPIDDLKGGVVGGSIIQGVLQVGDVIEIRPGIVTKDESGNVSCRPIRSRVISLLAENNNLLYAVPGGLIGVGLLIDPSFTRNDKLVGNVLGIPGSLPAIYQEITVKFYQLKRLLGASSGESKDKQHKIHKVTLGEILKLNVGSTETPGKISGIKEEMLQVLLINPVCLKMGDKTAFSRRIQKKYRLIGWGEIKDGRELALPA